MSKYVIDGETLKGIADVIREKTGKSEPIQTENFASEISLIQGSDNDQTLIELIERTPTHFDIPVGTQKIGYDAFHYCTVLESISIPDTVKRIEPNAFVYCRALPEITFPDSIVKIGSYSFMGCTALKKVNLPNAISEIEPYVFSDCTALEGIKFPNTVSIIGYNSFQNCTSCLEYDFSDHTAIPALDTNVFKNINSSARILVPSSLYIYWRYSKNWKSWRSYIVSVTNGSVGTTLQNSDIWLPGSNSGEHEADTSALSAYCQREGDAKIPISSVANTPYGLKLWQEPYGTGYDYQIRGDATFTEAGKYEVWVENGYGEKIYRRIIIVT